MIFFGILFIIIFIIISLEKPRLIGDIIKNVKTIRGLVMNIIYILPFLMVFFNVDSLSEWMTKRTNGLNQDNFNNKQMWWEDPKKAAKV